MWKIRIQNTRIQGYRGDFQFSIWNDGLRYSDKIIGRRDWGKQIIGRSGGANEGGRPVFYYKWVC